MVRGNTTITIPGGLYAPTPADRNGFQVRCVDKGNSDWRSISLDDVELSTNIMPMCEFLHPDMESEVLLFLK